MSESAFPSREELARRATRRVWRTLVLSGLIATLCVVVAIVVLPHHRQRTATHHTHGVAAGVLSAIVFVLVITAMVVLLRRMMRRSDGFLSPYLITGLPRKTRRVALRNIRRGTPSSDPMLANLERETAEKSVRQFRLSQGMFGLAVLFQAVDAFARVSTVTGLLFGLSALCFASLLAYSWVLLRRARRYLATAGLT